MNRDHIEMIKKHETYRDRAYDDATGRTILPGDTVRGKVTISWGVNITDVPLTRDECELLFTNRLVRAENEARAAFGWYYGLSADRRLVVVSMIFNLGMTRFKTFKRMIGALEREDWALAAKEMLDSDWADQVGDRAVELARLMWSS